MIDAANRAELPRSANTRVALLAPELFANPPDTAASVTSQSKPHTSVRLLVRLAAASDLGLAESLAQAGAAVQLLVPAGLPLPPTTLPLTRMPPGSTDAETNDLALALSDSLFVPADPPDLPLVRLARQLDKPFVVPGAEPPPIHARRGISHRLDPHQPGWHSWLKRLWGRPEQFFLELAAFAWQGRRHGGIAKSRGSLRACVFGASWPHTPHFGPANWQDLAPDRAALDPGRPIVAAFDRLDRSALYGAYIHRDLAWAAHLAAAFAVFFAVAGHIALIPGLPPHAWSGGELVALGIVLAATLVSRAVRLQDRWTACRFGAEQLRIARMCLPLLVVPRALCSKDKLPRADESQRALAEVKRAVRDQGLPKLPPDPSPLDAARWLHTLVADQSAYHRNNHHKLECAEQRLNALTVILFGLAVVAVGLHLADFEDPHLLIATAAMPAFAAAIHGVTTRLGFVHRIQLSLDAGTELLPIRQALGAMIEAGAADWPAVRTLAARAAEAMALETTSWHSQVRRQKDVIV